MVLIHLLLLPDFVFVLGERLPLAEIKDILYPHGMCMEMAGENGSHCYCSSRINSPVGLFYHCQPNQKKDDSRDCEMRTKREKRENSTTRLLCSACTLVEQWWLHASPLKFFSCIRGTRMQSAAAIAETISMHQRGSKESYGRVLLRTLRRMLI